MTSPSHHLRHHLALALGVATVGGCVVTTSKTDADDPGETDVATGDTTAVDVSDSGDSGDTDEIDTGLPTVACASGPDLAAAWQPSHQLSTTASYRLCFPYAYGAPACDALAVEIAAGSPYTTVIRDAVNDVLYADCDPRNDTSGETLGDSAWWADSADCILPWELDRACGPVDLDGDCCVGVTLYTFDIGRPFVATEGQRTADARVRQGWGPAPRRRPPSPCRDVFRPNR